MASTAMFFGSARRGNWSSGWEVDVLDQLCRAVAERRVVTLRYPGRDGAVGERTCHPHVVFESATGKTLLEAWQVEGECSGPLPCWRHFDLDRIESAHLHDERFAAPAPDYDPDGRRRARRILASV